MEEKKPTPVAIVETKKPIPVTVEPSKDVTPVKIIETEKPIPVTIEDEKKEHKLIDKASQQIKAPETTEEEDRVALGQRNINLIWENTQSQIAKATIYLNLAINALVILILIIFRREINKEVIIIIMSCLASLNGISGIIIGFYFSRTNHSAIGGTGKKDSSSNKGTR